YSSAESVLVAAVPLAANLSLDTLVGLVHDALDSPTPLPPRDLAQCILAIHEAMDGQKCSAFLKVDGVESESPAAHAGLQVGDVVGRFGSVVKAPTATHSTLIRQVTVVNARVGKGVSISLQRGSSTWRHLVLKPQKWKGKGLLGCVLQPYEPPPLNLRITSIPNQPAPRAPQNDLAHTSTSGPPQNDLAAFEALCVPVPVDPIPLPLGDLIVWHHKLLDAIDTVSSPAFVCPKEDAVDTLRCHMDATISQVIDHMQRHMIAMNAIPFLKVECVEVDSPAAFAGLRAGDLLGRVGSVMYYTGATHATLIKDMVGGGYVVGLVNERTNRGISISLLRGSRTWLPLVLRPHKWTGQGLLGCILHPFDAPERAKKHASSLKLSATATQPIPPEPRLLATVDALPIPMSQEQPDEPAPEPPAVHEARTLLEPEPLLLRKETEVPQNTEDATAKATEPAVELKEVDPPGPPLAEISQFLLEANNVVAELPVAEHESSPGILSKTEGLEVDDAILAPDDSVSPSLANESSIAAVAMSSCERDGLGQCAVEVTTALSASAQSEIAQSMEEVPPTADNQGVLEPLVEAARIPDPQPNVFPGEDIPTNPEGKTAERSVLQEEAIAQNTTVELRGEATLRCDDVCHNEDGVQDDHPPPPSEPSEAGVEVFESVVAPPVASTQEEQLDTLTPPLCQGEAPSAPSAAADDSSSHDDNCEQLILMNESTCDDDTAASLPDPSAASNQHEDNLHRILSEKYSDRLSTMDTSTDDTPDLGGTDVLAVVSDKVAAVDYNFPVEAFGIFEEISGDAALAGLEDNDYLVWFDGMALYSSGVSPPTAISSTARLDVFSNSSLRCSITVFPLRLLVSRWSVDVLQYKSFEVKLESWDGVGLVLPIEHVATHNNNDDIIGLIPSGTTTGTGTTPVINTMKYIVDFT
ncbi:hypothetical protein AaE_010804, partial [Aphanomyces astaci]